MTAAPQTWRGKASGWPAARVLLATAVSLALAATALTLAGERMSGTGLPALAIVAAVLAGFGAVRLTADALAGLLVVVRVDAAAVYIGPGLIPFSAMRIPIQYIRHATATTRQMQPWSSFGWWTTAQLTPAVLVRSGPALSIELTSGRLVTVSVNEPEKAAARVRKAKDNAVQAQGTR